eukprot:6486029-Pyramimonas_sp.AAC.1
MNALPGPICLCSAAKCALQRALVHRSDEDVLQNRLEFGLLDKKTCQANEPTDPTLRTSKRAYGA